LRTLSMALDTNGIYFIKIKVNYISIAHFWGMR